MTRTFSADSSYPNGQLNNRELIGKLICSDAYIHYVLDVNSNYRFVDLCFERVLGRSALQTELYQWSSLLTSRELETFAQKLISCDEHLKAFGNDREPHRRSQTLSSSLQGLPAFAKEASTKRYIEERLINQFAPSGYFRLPTTWTRKVGAVLAVAEGIEIAHIIVTIAISAFSSEFSG